MSELMEKILSGENMGKRINRSKPEKALEAWTTWR